MEPRGVKMTIVPAPGKFPRYRQRLPPVAQQIHTPGNDGNVLVAQVRTGQQGAFDLLRLGESELEKSSLPLA